MEGAFGNLGILISFVVAFIMVAKIDPVGILRTFGICMAVACLYYCTLFPLQPMKAIGAAVTQVQFGVTAGTVAAPAS